ncbi:MAG: GYD domain-containing protein [Pirellulales bacterium]|jgi:uncharacterized protein with GYD domain|nr:GYD domain-containing protein [Pirellulales bacterium]
MVRYAVLLSFTEKGIAKVGQSPARAEAFAKAVAKAKGAVESQVWTLGKYDGLIVFTAPDDKTAVSLVLKLGAAGNVRTTMLRAFDGSEFPALLPKA